MRNIHPTIAQAQHPFFWVGIKTVTRTLGCRVQAADSHQAMISALARTRIPVDDVPPAGIELKARVTA